MARSTKQKGIYQCPDGTWEVDCQYRKRRIRKRGFADHRSAKDFLTQQKAGVLQADGVKALPPVVTLEVAATRYLQEKHERGMPSAVTDAFLLKPLVETIGSLTLDELCDDAVAPFVEARRAQGIKTKTINNALAIINRICTLANTKWRHPNRAPWLAAPVKIDLLDLTDQRPPRPISWAEQHALLAQLPPHLADMALFCLSSGARKNVVCQLRWQWEVKVNTGGNYVSVFVVPREFVKGRKAERVLVCNSVGQAVIDAQRGRHRDRVFTYSRPVSLKNKARKVYVPIADMHNTAWQRARVAAGLDDLHVHDLRHAVGMRLRLAGVPERTQDEILWHSAKTMTAHYAVAQIREVYEALELIKQEGMAGETINLLAIANRARLTAITGKVPQKSPTQRKTA